MTHGLLGLSLPLFPTPDSRPNRAWLIIKCADLVANVDDI